MGGRGGQRGRVRGAGGGRVPSGPARHVAVQGEAGRQRAIGGGGLGGVGRGRERAGRERDARLQRVGEARALRRGGRGGGVAEAAPRQRERPARQAGPARHLGGAAGLDQERLGLRAGGLVAVVHVQRRERVRAEAAGVQRVERGERLQQVRRLAVSRRGVEADQLLGALHPGLERLPAVVRAVGEQRGPEEQDHARAGEERHPGPAGRPRGAGRGGAGARRTVAVEVGGRGVGVVVDLDEAVLGRRRGRVGQGGLSHRQVGGGGHGEGTARPCPGSKDRRKKGEPAPDGPVRARESSRDVGGEGRGC
ncbi:hypothetical protein PSR1_03610 [Anaeromyxobacter sp. PSR-1]|nr:hypothetical protein PSR1_03610 [Anaeromyxobacter sp. PSR-1]